MENKIKELKEQFELRMAEALTAEELEALRVSFLGKKGQVTELLKGLRDVPAEKKKEVGQLINDLKTSLEGEIEAAEESLRSPTACWTVCASGTAKSTAKNCNPLNFQ